MQPDERDAALLWDMREAALLIEEFVKNITYERFITEKMIRYAVERQVMIIGEAATRISDKFKIAHPDIPWKSIIGQRNVLAHEYGEIIVERIWLVAKERIPQLIQLLTPLIPPPPKD